MDLSKLESVSSESLQAIRDKCIEELAKRRAGSLRTGSVGWFLDSKGAKRYLFVERVNHKSVSGYEVDATSHGRLNMVKWRVSSNLLNIVGEPAPAFKPPAAPIVPHKPSTATDSTW